MKNHRYAPFVLLLGVGCWGAGGDSGSTSGPTAGSVDSSPTFVPTNEPLGQDSTLAVLLADFTGDGAPDLLESNEGKVSWMRFNVGGKFDVQKVPVMFVAPTHLGAADLDGDGDLDAVLLRSGAAAIANNFGGGILYVNQPFAGGSCFALGDINGDGKTDIVVGDGLRCFLYLNNGTGTPVFAGGINLSGGSGDVRALAVGDVDQDGDQDIVTGRDGPTTVWLNNGTNPPIFNENVDLYGEESTRIIFLVDMNGDGHPDIAVGNADGTSRLWINSGAATFSEGALWGSGTTAAAAPADLDGDGDIDIAEATGSVVLLWINSGTGALAPAPTPLPSPAARAISSGDINGDGKVDLAVGNGDSKRNEIWLNQ